MYYTFPTTAEAAGRDLLEAAPQLIQSNSRSAGEMASRVCEVMGTMPVAWLPTVDTILRAAEPSHWTALDPRVFGRPRPASNLKALVELGVCHPNPQMRVWALTQVARGPGRLHYLLLRLDDPAPAPRHLAYEAAEACLRAPGTTHAFVANLPLLDWLRADGAFDHSELLDQIEARLQSEAGRQALSLAASRSSREELRAAAAQRLDLRHPRANTT